MKHCNMEAAVPPASASVPVAAKTSGEKKRELSEDICEGGEPNSKHCRLETGSPMAIQQQLAALGFIHPHNSSDWHADPLQKLDCSICVLTTCTNETSVFCGDLHYFPVGHPYEWTHVARNILFVQCRTPANKTAHYDRMNK